MSSSLYTLMYRISYFSSDYYCVTKILSSNIKENNRYALDSFEENDFSTKYGGSAKCGLEHRVACKLASESDLDYCLRTKH